jgi:hypothetical protein
MSLALGQGTDTVHESERCDEVGETQRTLEMVCIDDSPAGLQLAEETFLLPSGERGRSTLAGHTVLVGEVRHAGIVGLRWVSVDAVGLEAEV